MVFNKAIGKNPVFRNYCATVSLAQPETISPAHRPFVKLWWQMETVKAQPDSSLSGYGEQRREDKTASLELPYLALFQKDWR